MEKEGWQRPKSLAAARAECNLPVQNLPLVSSTCKVVGCHIKTAAYSDGVSLRSAAKMLPKNHAAKDVSQRLSSVLPSFQDIFDEESFYIFAFFITVLTCVGAFVASRYVTIKDAGHLD